MSKKRRPSFLVTKGKFSTCSTSAADSNFRDNTVFDKILFFLFKFVEEKIYWTSCKTMFPDTLNLMATTSARSDINNKIVVIDTRAIFK